MIILYKGFKYDNSYTFIKTFKSKAEQEKYFYNLDKIIIENDEYKKEFDSFNIQINYDELVNEGINYIQFDNGYNNVYAFITSKKYLNDKVTRINYEVDVIQTYLFNFNINKSFIERKKCKIDEITDYDEGIYLGDYVIENEEIAINKESKYFAMFNGFKEQQLIFDNNILKSVVELPYNTSKPLTTVNGIQYPLYFMPLQEQSKYKLATYSDIGIGGQLNSYSISTKIYRFLKGYEGFGQYPYMGNNEKFFTYGYGITEKFQKEYYDRLGVAPVTEEKASLILADLMLNNFVKPLYDQMKNDGVNVLTMKRNHFDAFLSLAYNGGLGLVTSSAMYKKFLVNPDDRQIATIWLDYATNGGLQGLIDRRLAESNIYSGGLYEYRTIVTVNSKGAIDGAVTSNNGNGFIPSNLQGEL